MEHETFLFCWTFSKLHERMILHLHSKVELFDKSQGLYWNNTIAIPVRNSTIAKTLTVAQFCFICNAFHEKKPGRDC